VQKSFDRFGVTADYIAKKFWENFSAKTLKKKSSADFIEKNLQKNFSTEFNFFPQK
jgi:hypothetical protein